MLKLRHLLQRKKPVAINMVIETEQGRYFHEHKVKAMLNTIINCTVEDAPSVIKSIAKAEKLKLNG